MKTVLLTTAALVLCASYTDAPAGASFEGVITYGITVEGGDNPQMAQAMQSFTLKTYIKGDWFRTEQNSGMANSIMISNSKDPKNPIILMDLMGSKYQLKMDDPKMKAKAESKPEIKYLKGTKTIAGYECKEAQITVTDKKTGSVLNSDVYYTDKLPYSNDGYQNNFKGLNGFPLSYSMSQQGMNFTMTAKSVEKISVPDSLFKVPAGYKLATSDEMQKEMMQKMGGGGQ